MKKTKKILALLLATTLIAPATHSFSTKASIDTTKLTNPLVEQIQKASKKETIPVVIWTTDIDQEKVEQKVESTTGIDSDEFYSSDNLTKLSAVAENIAKDDSLSTSDQIKKYLKETKAERKKQLKETELYTKAERKIAKEEYKLHNSNFQKEYLAKKNILFSSSYAPMIITEVTASDIEKIAKKSNVVSIDYYDDTHQDEIDMSTSKATTKSNYLANTEDLTGDGIKIGVYDAGCVDLTDQNVRNANITNITTTVHQHTTQVSSCIAGPTGTAPNAELYVTGGGNLYTNIELLLDRNVNLINCCYGYSSGQYDSEARFFDHISAQHRVTVVSSAGNTPKKMKISSQSMGYNVISVGAINTKGTTSVSDDEIADFSTTAYDDVMKPEVYAPGEDIVFPDGTTNSGTSFATPITTGICAQLMEAFPELERNPRLMKSVLLVTARNLKNYSYDQVSNVTNTLHCGVVNAQAAYNLLSDRKYDYGYLLSASNRRSWRSSIVPTTTGLCRVCLVWEIDNQYASGQQHSSSTGLSVGQMPRITMVIEDSRYRVVGSSTLTNTAYQICEFTAVAGHQFYVRIDTDDALTDNLSFAYAFL